MEKKLAMDDLQNGSKNAGIVTWVERFGVFIAIENSELRVMVQLMECIDNYIRSGLVYCKQTVR